MLFLCQLLLYFQGAYALIQVRSLSFLNKKPLFEEKNHYLLHDKTGNTYKDVLIQSIEDAVENKVVTRKIAENIKKVIENFEINQIFGRKEIKSELNYGDSKAGKTIEIMLSLNVIKSVEGKGKGKYVLKSECARDV